MVRPQIARQVSMSIVIYYPEAPRDDLWDAQETITNLYAGLEAADLHWYVSLVLGRPRPGGEDGGEAWLRDLAAGYVGPNLNLAADEISGLLMQAPHDMSLPDDELLLLRLDSAGVVHVPSSTTAVRLAETRRRGRAPAGLKIVWSPLGGPTPAMRLAQRLAQGDALDPSLRERLIALQRWIDHRALEVADAILVEDVSDLDAFAASVAARELLLQSAAKVWTQRPAVPEPPDVDVISLRQRFGLSSASLVIAMSEVASHSAGANLRRDVSEVHFASLTLKDGRAWVSDAHGWSDRGWMTPVELLAACDVWVDAGDGRPQGRRWAVQGLSLGKPGISSDAALTTFEGVLAYDGAEGLRRRILSLRQRSRTELSLLGAMNRRDYLDRFAPAEAGRRYVEHMTTIAGRLVPFSATPPRPTAPSLHKTFPRVTVIATAFNVGEYIGDCLDSVCGQTYANLEIIVVNDGSVDNSAAVIHARAKRDPRITVIDQLNHGLSTARNAGLDLATGDYICFVDGDDVAYPTYVERMLECAIREDLHLVACAIEYQLPDGEIRYHSTFHSSKAKSLVADNNVLDLHDKAILTELFPSAWNKLYKRELFSTVRFPSGLYYEDHPVFFSVAFDVERCGYIGDALYRQRLERPGSITREGGERLFDIFPVLRQVFDIFRSHVLAPASLRMFKQIAIRLLWERSNLIADRHASERFAACATQLFQETGVSTVQSGANDQWIPSAAHIRFKEEGGVEMQCTIVLTYSNDAKYIWSLLDTLERQSMRQIEVMAVDNGSVDGSSAVVSTKCAVDDRFTRLVHDGVVGGARNTGAARATGKYILFIEGNDMVSADAIERFVSFAEDYDADVMISAFEYVGLEQRHYHSGFHVATPLRGDAEGATRGVLPVTGRALVSSILAFPCNKLFRRSFLEEHAIKFESEGFYEEHAFWCDVADSQPRVAYTSEVLYRVRDEVGARRLWNGAGHAFDAVKALRSLAGRMQKIDDHALLARLCVRLAWERLTFALTTPMVRAALVEACMEVVTDVDPGLFFTERDEYISEEFVRELLDGRGT